MALEDQLARLAADDSPYGVVAEFIGETSAPDLDGAQWRLRMIDGTRVELIDLRLSGSEGGRVGMDVDPFVLEAAAERLSGKYPREVRLAAMAADCRVHGHLWVNADDLRRLPASPFT